MNVTDANAYSLFSFLKFDTYWVDTLALHLDYDKSFKNLSLPTHPSLCIAILENTGALYALASPDSIDLDS